MRGIFINPLSPMEFAGLPRKLRNEHFEGNGFGRIQNKRRARRAFIGCGPKRTGSNEILIRTKDFPPVCAAQRRPRLLQIPHLGSVSFIGQRKHLTCRYGHFKITVAQRAVERSLRLCLFLLSPSTKLKLPSLKSQHFRLVVLSRHCVYIYSRDDRAALDPILGLFA